MRPQLLLVSAIAEAAVGLALLVAPGLVAAVLLGGSLESAGATVIARVAGAGLLALGVACARARSAGDFAVVSGMTVYNVVAAAVLAHAVVQLGIRQPALVGAVVLHLVMAAWCLVALRHAGEVR